MQFATASAILAQRFTSARATAVETFPDAIETPGFWALTALSDLGARRTKHGDEHAFATTAAFVTMVFDAVGRYPTLRFAKEEGMGVLLGATDVRDLVEPILAVHGAVRQLAGAFPDRMLQLQVRSAMCHGRGQRLGPNEYVGTPLDRLPIVLGLAARNDQEFAIDQSTVAADEDQYLAHLPGLILGGCHLIDRDERIGLFEPMRVHYPSVTGHELATKPLSLAWDPPGGVGDTAGGTA